MIDFDAFRQIVGPLSQDSAKPWPEERERAWHAVFQGFPAGSLVRAVARMKLTGRTWDAEIFDLMRFLAEEAYGVLPDADQAFAEVKAALAVWYPAAPDECRRASGMLSPWAAEALRGVGGFSAAFHSDNPQVFLGQFTRAYERVIGRAVRERLLPGHLKPKPAIAAKPEPKAIERPKRKAVAAKPAALPAPADPSLFADRLARKLGDFGPVPVRQTAEEASAVKADQERRLREFQAKR